jgi:glutamate:GABA antiporter
LLPGWFAELHPRFKTPVNSILFVGGMILALGLLGISGVGQQEAFQLLTNSSEVFYAIAYLALFALPLFGLRGLKSRPAWWLRAAMAAGLLVTVLFCVMALVPIVNVASRLAFAVKIGGVIVAGNLVGMSLYWLEKRSSAR